MSKHKNFKNLFGCDDSDEENLQDEFSSENLKKVSALSSFEDSKRKHSFKDTYEIMKHKEKKKIDKVNTENDKKYEKIESREAKRTKSYSDEHQKKKMKKEYMIDEDIFEHKSHEVILDSTESNDNLNKSSDIREMQISDIENEVRLKKTQIGGLVVKLLTPAYAERRFDSKDTFKTLARNISHALYDKDEHEIRDYIKNFLNRNEEFTSHTTL